MKGIAKSNLYVIIHLIQLLHKFFYLPILEMRETIKKSKIIKQWQAKGEDLLWVKHYQPPVLFIDSITCNFRVPLMCQIVCQALE